MNLNVSNALKRTDVPQRFDLNGEIRWEYPEARLNEKIRVSGEYVWNGKYIPVEAIVETVLDVKCDRCLADFKLKIDLPVLEVFSKEEVMDFPDVYSFSGDTLELDEMICHNILLSLPAKLLCSEKCLGICPKCGVNRNEQSCDCE